MAFSVQKKDGTVFDLQAFAVSIQKLDRRREYALQQGRAVDSTNWGVSGDGKENPTPIQLRLNLRRSPTRAQNRADIDRIEAALSQAAILIDTADLREWPVHAGVISVEQPVSHAYTLELTFYPKTARPGYSGAFPLGALQIIGSGAGYATVEPLPGVSVTPTTFILEGEDGAQFIFDTLEASYG